MLYWVGPRDSDISYTGDMFDGAITLFGDEINNNSSAYCKHYHSRVNHNIIDVDQDSFTFTEIANRIEKDKEAKFIFYNPNIVFKTEKLSEFRKYILCLNDVNLMRQLNNKIRFRKLFEDLVNMLVCMTVTSEQCQYENLREMFKITDKETKFVVQAPVASGGYGTFILNSDNGNEIRKEIIPGGEYLVSEFIQNSVPVNSHIIIFKDDILFTPSSVQIMKESDDRLFYRGADFITYKKIPEHKRKIFEKEVSVVGRKLQQMGYRGICGIDGMITEDDVYILEVNNRFQASTPLINLSLSKVGLPSLHKLNCQAFEDGGVSKQLLDVIPNLDVSYSNYVFTSGDVDFHLVHFYERVRANQGNRYIEELVEDGYSKSQTSERYAYQFKIIFNTNITGIDGNNEIIIHNDIEEPSKEFYRKVEKKEYLYMKVALLNQGLYFTSKAIKQLEENGGIRPGTNCSVDVLMDDDIVINCPVNNKFTDFSPFSVEIQNGKLALFYYHSFLKNIKINPVDVYSMKRTQNGVQFAAIANMSSDRLRLHHTNACIFKREGKGCAFCDIRMEQQHIALEDIYEVIDFYLEFTKFEHFLVGGQSEISSTEYDYIISTIKYIRGKSDKKIYVMCLPPKDKSVIKELYDAGATEIAFNIEIFNRSLAAEIMPGKGQLPLSQYMEALKEGVVVWGKGGEVRSIVLVGVENDKTFFQGVELLAKNYVQPILSVFRPLPRTEMFDNIPPSNKYLIDVYNKAENICAKYGVTLGPSCVQCQNNTLSLPERYR